MSTPMTQKAPQPEQPASLVQVEHKEDFINEVDHISGHGDYRFDNAGHGLDKRELAKTIRKVDLIVLPVMTVVLAFSFIDRTNMGLAAVAGMVSELGLKGNEFSISLLAYFPGYVVFVLPSNYILSKWSIRGWLTVLTITFGIFTLGIGLIQNFASLVVMRFFLGICEAGVYPTVISAISAWYPRHYIGKRVAFVVTGASLISALAGIIAWALSRIHVNDYAGWRWIFLIEGAVTVVVGCIVFFVLDEYPESSKFLSGSQKALLMGLIHHDRVELEEERLTVRLVVENLKDWTLWVYATMYMLTVSTTYGIAYFMPLILNGQMGFSGATSQLLSTPPYFYSLILAGSLSWVSDKHRIRSPFIIFFSLNMIMGIALTRWGPNTGSQYLGLFFVLGGALAQGPMVIVWGQNNAPTRTKRSVSAALLFTFGAIGGIIGSTVFRAQDAPKYTPGVVTLMCCTGAILVSLFVLAWHFDRKNRAAKEKGRRTENQGGFSYTL